MAQWKWTEEKVEAVRCMVINGLPYRAIGKKMRVSERAISVVRVRFFRDLDKEQELTELEKEKEKKKLEERKAPLQEHCESLGIECQYDDIEQLLEKVGQSFWDYQDQFTDMGHFVGDELHTPHSNDMNYREYEFLWD